MVNEVKYGVPFSDCKTSAVTALSQLFSLGIEQNRFNSLWDKGFQYLYNKRSGACITYYSSANSFNQALKLNLQKVMFQVEYHIV